MVSEPSLIVKLDPSPITESVPRRILLHSRQIPWGYGRDRLTAIAVDPDRLFVYWEVLDASLDAARERLGPSGARAALVLRVFDTTGRLFDGENAHSYFDQDVQRNDRQWFCQVGKPSSSTHIEMGLRTPDGRFLKLMRSGRVDFPSKSPAGDRPAEWMRVVASTGDIVSRETALPHGVVDPGGGHAGFESSGGGISGEAAATSGGVDGGGSSPTDRSEGAEFESYEIKELDVERYETDSGWQINELDPGTVYRMVTMSWQELGMGLSTWEAGPTANSWEAGPFSYPTEVIAPAIERFEGQPQVYRMGEHVRVLHGPWQVVIRGINAHSSRRVLARWEVHRSWLGFGTRSAEAAVAGPLGHNGAPIGASERFLAASELRLKGASEIFYLGASERRLGGSSETRFIAASQWIARGASEKRFAGASEFRFAGASELRLKGASERRLGGASEKRLVGASERRLEKGASEQRLGASEKRLGGASEARLADSVVSGHVSNFPPAPTRKV